MQTLVPQPTSNHLDTVKAIIITNFPETLRSTVLLDFHQGQNWLDSTFCPGISSAKSRDDLEGEIFLAGLPKPPSHVYEAMSLSEVGCTYAHLKALTIAANSGRPTLILEDDAEFEPEKLRQVLGNLDRLLDGSVVKLEGDDKPGRRIVVGSGSANRNFMISLRPSRGSAAYLVTPVSAASLIEAAYNYPLPYDVLLNDSNWHGCFLMDAVPFPIRQAGQTSSTITRGVRKRGVTSRVARQSEKFRYRLRRIATQLQWARKAKFTQVRFAKFYDKI
ncbi:MAG: glycosyltransferase family 25 protein [Armatimonadota bacterium]